MNCITRTNNRKISVKEKSKCFILLNQKRKFFDVMKIDGCLVMGKRACDWMMRPACRTKEIYIELKGSDIKYAVDQITQSIVEFSSDRSGVPKECYIISSRCPLSSPEVQSIAIRLKKEYNARILIRSQKLEVAFQD